jgi:hypothetical protein
VSIYTGFLNIEDQKMHREGREILFSLDVETLTGKHYFHVAAQSAKEAILQFEHRDDAASLGEIIGYAVYDGSLETRTADQKPLLVVNKP